MRHISKREMDRWHCQWHRIPSESIHRAMRLLDQTLLQPTQPLHIYLEGRMEVEYMKNVCVCVREREREQQENVSTSIDTISIPTVKTFYHERTYHRMVRDRPNPIRPSPMLRGY